MTLKPCTYNWDIRPIIVCSNDDPMLTLTYFSARSYLVSYAFETGQLLPLRERLCIYKAFAVAQIIVVHFIT